MNRTLQMPGDFSIRTQAVTGFGEPHAHDFLELAYIRSGWAQHTVNGKTRRLEAGDFVLIDFGEVHSYDLAGEGLTVVNCLFQPAAVDPSLSRCRSFRTLLSSCMIGVGYACAGVGEFEKIFHDGQGRILAVLERLEEEFRCRDIGYYPLIRVLLIDLIVQTVRMIGERAPAPSGAEVSWILEELRRDPAAPHTLSGYAAQFHMRPEALSRLFRRQVGEGFAARLRRSRAELACRLLLETKDPVPEIAERCGYLDGKTFREAFRAVTGLSPRAYRTRYSLRGRD